MGILLKEVLVMPILKIWKPRLRAWTSSRDPGIEHRTSDSETGEPETLWLPVEGFVFPQVFPAHVGL